MDIGIICLTIISGACLWFVGDVFFQTRKSLKENKELINKLASGEYTPLSKRSDNKVIDENFMIDEDTVYDMLLENSENTGLSRNISVDIVTDEECDSEQYSSSCSDTSYSDSSSDSGSSSGSD